MTDLLADKQKKGGREVKEQDCDTFFPDLKKILLQNYNGLGVLSSSMYMTGL